MNDIFCANCAHYDKGKCFNSKGLLYNIKISEALAEADHDCEVFEEAYFRLTEAGYLYLAMEEEGINVDLAKAKRICDSFFKGMIEGGILRKEDNDE